MLMPGLTVRSQWVPQSLRPLLSGSTPAPQAVLDKQRQLGFAETKRMRMVSRWQSKASCSVLPLHFLVHVPTGDACLAPQCMGWHRAEGHHGLSNAAGLLGADVQKSNDLSACCLPRLILMSCMEHFACLAGQARKKGNRCGAAEDFVTCQQNAT